MTVPMPPSFSLSNVLIVALGSATGGVLRFGAAHLGALLPLPLPWSTLGVNIVGSFLIGLVTGGVEESTMRLLLATGFCGGFTTFSAFSLETLALGSSHGWPLAVANIALNVSLAIGACALGMWLTGK